MKNKPVKVMLIIMISLLIIGVGSVVGYKYMKASAAADKTPTAAQLAQNQYELDKLMTNLSGTAVIQVTFVLQADSQQTRTELELRKGQVLDLVNGVLHNLTRDQLAAPNGQQQLKLLIAQKVNKILTHGKVTDVFIENIVVQ